MINFDGYGKWIASAPEPLRDCWKRLWWANTDGQRLIDALEAFVRPPNGACPYAVFIEIHGNRGRASFVRHIEESAEHEAFENFGRLLGNFLDNYRAALNYLAYELAKMALREHPSLASESLPFAERLRPESVEFPIFKKAAKYWDKNKVGKLPQEYRSAIEAVQPCFGGDEALWDLQTLAAEYRHRLIHPIGTIAIPEMNDVLLDGVSIARNLTVRIDPSRPLQDKAEVLTFTIPDSVPPDRYPDVYPVIATSIGVDHPLCANRDIVEVLSGINRAMRVIMRGFPLLFDPNWTPPPELS